MNTTNETLVRILSIFQTKVILEYGDSRSNFVVLDDEEIEEMDITGELPDDTHFFDEGHISDMDISVIYTSDYNSDIGCVV